MIRFILDVISFGSRALAWAVLIALVVLVLLGLSINWLVTGEA